jgi:small subunit ribosomal protein S9
MSTDTPAVVATPTVEQTWATGRRKTAVASVRLAPGAGKFEVNRRPFESYFPNEVTRNFIIAPLEVTASAGKFDIFVNAKGGGPNGQAGAVRHGLARALAKLNPDFRKPLKEAGFLTRDPRMKERKKSGQPGARKRFQFSKR